MKIWGRLDSTNVKKVLWCADELALDYQRIDVGGRFGGLNEQDYRALNPNGLIPCLQDGDLVLWESNAMVRYLSARYGEGRLYDADPAVRAVADKWMDWATSTLVPPYIAWFINRVRKAPPERDDEAMEKGRQTLARALAVADQTLARQPYLSGDRFAMGDIPLGCLVYAWFELDIERPPLPHLEAWYGRLRKRSAYRDRVMIPIT
ncbi:glutathione S-transferase [Alcanivorax sp. N3-2A]|nr:glutathione S-transferase [Alcanivorax sp. N3-2A]|tara:strand:- start:25192 stop:25809 length:618 start_codon:yes stop_codon:yes gene_type:complete